MWIRRIITQVIAYINELTSLLQAHMLVFEDQVYFAG